MLENISISKVNAVIVLITGIVVTALLSHFFLKILGEYIIAIDSRPVVLVVVIALCIFVFQFF